MRTVTFKSVLHGVATRIGLEPDANLQANQAEALTEYINTNLEDAWEMAPWPEWTKVELRRFRADWDATTSYVIGDEVFYAGAYYRCLADNLNNVPDVGFFWEGATDMSRNISRTQSWQANQIGEVWGVFLDDPMTHQRPRKAGFWEDPAGIHVDGGTAVEVYVEFGLVPPVFTAAEWEQMAEYVAGDLVYLPSSGECYVALQAGSNQDPATQSLFWRQLPFPKVLARYVKLACIADALREDADFSKAAVMDGQAADAIMDALDHNEKMMREIRGYHGTPVPR